MKWALKVYFAHIKVSVSTSLSYRLDFLFTLLINFFSNLLLPLFALLIYSSDLSIGDWSFHEVLLIQSTFAICAGFCAPLFSNVVWLTMFHIKQGSYDLLMIKPGSTLFITVAQAFEFDSIGVFLGGIVLFVYSITEIGNFTSLQFLKFFVFIFGGILFMLGLILIMTSTAFKWVGNSRIFEIFNSVTTLGRYPLTIYSKVLQGVLTFILPISMIGFYPASALLGKDSPVMFFAFIPCVLIFIFSVWLFNKMIYLYQSAGG